MILHVIHDRNRKDRYDLLMKEVEQQHLEIKIWDAVKGLPKTIMNISAAHRRIVQHAKDMKMPEILIGEDDLHFTCDGAFEYYLSKKPKEFDLYLAGVICGKLCSDNTISDFGGLQCYIIHERYYNTFLESDPNRDIDRVQTRRGVFHVCNPFAVVQHETLSDNSKKIHRQARLYHDKIIYNGTNG